jgi:hypothetical protein
MRPTTPIGERSSSGASHRHCSARSALRAPSSWGLAPDRERRPGRLAQGGVLLGLAGFAVFAVTGIVTAYSL